MEIQTKSLMNVIEGLHFNIMLFSAILKLGDA